MILTLENSYNNETAAAAAAAEAMTIKIQDHVTYPYVRMELPSSGINHHEICSTAYTTLEDV